MIQQFHVKMNRETSPGTDWVHGEINSIEVCAIRVVRFLSFHCQKVW